jgi:hypothetical protein
MKNPKEQYRNALRFLINKNRTDIKILAEKVGCTVRHIQGFLSEKERKGMGSNLGQAIAEYYQMSFSQVLDLGTWILAGKDPEKFQPRRISSPKISEVIIPTRGSTSGKIPSQRITIDDDPSKTQLIAMALDVLESMTKHAAVLASNIQIFYNAVRDQEEMASMYDKIQTMQQKIKELTDSVLVEDALKLDPGLRHRHKQ